MHWIIEPFYILFAAFMLLYLPGRLITGRISKLKGDRMHLVSLGVGLLVIPNLCVALALLLKSIISMKIILLAALIVYATCPKQLLSLLSEAKKIRTRIHLPLRSIALAIGAVLLLVLYMGNYQPVEWKHSCIETVSYLSTHEEGIGWSEPNPLLEPERFSLPFEEGLHMFELEGSMVGNLRNDGRPVTTDERIGTIGIYSVAYSLFGGLGFAFIDGLAWMIGSVALYLVGSAITRRRGLAALVVGIIAMSSLFFSIHEANPNVIAFMAISLVLLIGAEAPTLSGLIFWNLVALRYVSVLLIIAMILLLYKRKWKEQYRRFFMGTVVLIPYLILNWMVFGSPIYNQALGTLPQFEYSIFGIHFSYSSLLNFPIHDILVRTPHVAYPGYLLLPISLMAGMGLMLWALSVSGLFMDRSRRNRWISFTAIAPSYLVLAIHENWFETDKLSYLLIILPFLIIGALRYIRGRFTRKKVLVICAVLLASLVLLWSASILHVPADERWYQTPLAGIVSSNAEKGVYMYHATPNVGLLPSFSYESPVFPIAVAQDSPPPSGHPSP